VAEVLVSHLEEEERRGGRKEEQSELVVPCYSSRWLHPYLLYGW
jgi:hypothetical protein